MSRLFKSYILGLMLLASASVVAENNCTGYNPDKHPDHYCDCKNNYSQLNTLPFDIMVTDSVWFKGSSNIFMSGFTAYLYSDCDVNFDVYQNCTTKKLVYSVTIPKNQARDMSAESIKQKIDEAGVSITGLVVYICIYPVNGQGGRLMCYPYNTGHNSTCNDLLHLLPGMTFVSSHAEDTYEIQASSIPDSYAMSLQWNGDSNLPCHLQITRGDCHGTIIAEHDFVDQNSNYYFDPDLLVELRAKGESLYAHFSHDASTAGRIRLLEAATMEHVTDTTLCQGKAFQMGDMTFRTDTTLIYNRQWQDNVLGVYAYRLTFAQPEIHIDTLCLRSTELPYLYREQYTIPADGFGDYDFTIHHDGECDERYLLHVAHQQTTIRTTVDTTLCQGRKFIYNNKTYKTDVTFVDTSWLNVDTLSIHTLNVHFSAPEVQYDTIYRKSNAFPFRYKSKYSIYGFGDYDCPIEYADACNEHYLLHVAHDISVTTISIDTTLCQGRVFEYEGAEYTADTAWVDTIDIDADTRKIVSLHVSFAAPEIQYDTLHVKSTELPYLYRGQYTIPAGGYGDYDILIENPNECTERYLLHVSHATSTIYTTVDTTLCQGRSFMHNGQAYTSAITLVDSAWLNIDTFGICTTNVYFTAPEIQYDTLHVKSTELPYLYRGQYTIPAGGYGDYDILIHTDGECDERYLLHVEHEILVYMSSIDTTLCQGRIFKYEGAEYTSDTAWVDTIDIDADTRKIVSLHVSFAAPEIQYDTLHVKSTELPYLYRGQYTIPAGGYGDYDILIENPNECTERYLLHVSHATSTIYTTVDTTLCQGRSFMHNGQAYTSAITLVDSAWLNIDTFCICTTNVYFTAPEIQYDTILVQSTELPYLYRGQYTIPADGYGDYDILIHTDGECDERYLLHVEHEILVYMSSIDTTLCQGRIFEYKGAEYTSDTIFYYQGMLTEDIMESIYVSVSFTAPEMEYDTVLVATADLETGYYYPVADTYIYAPGTYFYEILNYNDCTRHISLTVIEDIKSGIHNTFVTPQPRIIMMDGVVFIQNGENLFTILGEKVTDRQLNNNVHK